MTFICSIEFLFNYDSKSHSVVQKMLLLQIMNQSAFELSFLQLLKPTVECDKLHYKHRDAFVHQAWAI